MELVRGVSLSTLRAELHQKYGTLCVVRLIAMIDDGQGDIIRIAPNEVNGRVSSRLTSSSAHRRVSLAAPLCETDGVQ